MLGVPADRIAVLRRSFDGEVILPNDAAYDAARQVWNAMIDRRPSIILRPNGTADVATAVRFARDEGLEIAVKGGGHSPAGHATVDDGALIDLASLRAVRVDSRARRALVAGGARLLDVDREAAGYGLAVPAGVNWDTGIGGLTLGGGYGWLSRLHGLTCDNLISAEVVTADGEVVVAGADGDEELLWGLAGGGGNFGIVTWFEFRAHPVPPLVHTRDLVFDFADRRQVVEAFLHTCARAPRELTAYLGLEEWTADPDAGRHGVGRPVVTVGFVMIANPSDLASLTAPLSAAAEPLSVDDWSGGLRDLQRMTSEAPGARRRRYWRGLYVVDTSDAFVDAFIVDDSAADGRFFGGRELVLQGGAIGDRASDACAFANRDATFDVLAIGYWDDPREDSVRLSALRAAADRLTPFATGVYLNNLVDDAEARIRAAFRDDRFERLRRLKSRLDPENVFHRNANIPPAAARDAA